MTGVMGAGGAGVQNVAEGGQNDCLCYYGQTVGDMNKSHKSTKVRNIWGKFFLVSLLIGGDFRFRWKPKYASSGGGGGIQRWRRGAKCCFCDYGQMVGDMNKGYNSKN